jgi:hypothetical protein
MSVCIPPQDIEAIIGADCVMSMVEMSVAVRFAVQFFRGGAPAAI